MTPEEYKRAGELFHQLREMPEGERPAALNAACETDPALRAQIELLLEGDREAASGSFLKGHAIEDAARLLAPEAPNLPPSGTVVGHYRLNARIGAGGMGVVYEAEDLHLPRRVAIKVLPMPSAAQSKERIQRFQREARAASQLNHPHIVSIFDAGLDQGCYYIAMEFVEGRTLRALMTAEPRFIDSKTLLEIIGQTASALSAAHQAGIVHRDIKPENIMVRPDGFVKVLDFGLATMLEPSSSSGESDLRTRPGHLAGTIQYLSPEQVLGKPAGPQSDVFSLGVVAYELGTGGRPFDGPTDGAVFEAIVHRDPAPPSALRPALGNELDGLIMGALEKDPELRFQSAGELRSACKRLGRTSTPATVVPVPKISTRRASSSSAARPARDWRSLQRVGAAVSAIALGVTLLWMTRPLAEPRVTRNVQITSGEPVTAFVNDGTRIYYSTGKADSNAPMFEVSVHGGAPIALPNFRGMLPLDISPDRSEILLREMASGGDWESHSLWAGSVLGTPPRRLGDLQAIYAHWSSHGDKIVFTFGSEVRVAGVDGSGLRILFHVNQGHASAPFFFDDDRRIRFSVAQKNTDELWEVNADGSDPHRVLPGWTGGLQAESTMSADGKYSVFAAGQNDKDWDLWALREYSGLLRFHRPKPFRLTTGPLVVAYPQLSPDGRRIFYLGSAGLDELVRYDPKSQQWVAYLGGIDAFQLDFSRDGEWATYVGPPGNSVWRSRADGSRATQLTTPPLKAVNPRWSPDGRNIVFYGGVPGQPTGMFLMRASGGAVTTLAATGKEIEPSWSPDSQKVLYMTAADGLLAVMNVNTRETEELPNSEGLLFPRWSPDGKYAAAPNAQSYLWLYDMTTHQRTLLTTVGAGYPAWSRDSKYVYFENSACSVWYRVSVRDHATEEIVSLAGLRMATNALGWVGMAPDGSVISSRDASTRNIYALDWETP